ncbi:hypothetical protein CISIN_1g035232mg [Citrus sinensis]|uniref:Uncharacterized protein n=1 Tax=Citrus sinensis TaxID=2711 RepID=A0A067GAL0_CITSI|nr:hypothetical protein CISIN_1g035232mg [Citrus sinensis]
MLHTSIFSSLRVMHSDFICLVICDPMQELPATHYNRKPAGDWVAYNRWGLGSWLKSEIHITLDQNQKLSL